MQGDQPDWQVLQSLRFSHLDLVPEQITLFFHRVPHVRVGVRRTASRGIGLNQNDPLLFFEQFLAILDDSSQAEKHADAIRVINLTGRRLREDAGYDMEQRVTHRLHQVLREGDEQLLGPTLSALKSIVGKDIAWAHILQPALQGGAVSDDRLSILQDEDTILKLVSEEKRLERRAGGG